MEENEGKAVGAMDPREDWTGTRAAWEARRAADEADRAREEGERRAREERARGAAAADRARELVPVTPVAGERERAWVAGYWSACREAGTVLSLERWIAEEAGRRAVGAWGPGGWLVWLAAVVAGAWLGSWGGAGAGVGAGAVAAGAVWVAGKELTEARLLREYRGHAENVRAYRAWPEDNRREPEGS